MLGHQVGDRLRSQQRRVAGEDEHVVVVEVVLGEAGEAHGHGVARAPLLVLLDELEAQAGAVLHQLLGDPLGAVAHDDDGPVELGGRQGVEDVQDHGPTAQQVQRLGPGGPHAGSLAGRQHDGGKTTRAHTDRSTPLPTDRL